MAAKNNVKYPIFNFDLCVSCHMCEQGCPVSAITLDVNGIDRFKNLYPRVRRNLCIGCGICENQCTVNAVTMTDA